MSRWRILALVGLSAMASGCAHAPRPEYIPPPPPPPPAGARLGGPAPVQPAPSLPPARTATAARVIASHRQYFDQRHKRYYFYDPSRRAYFWEDGEPKR